MNRRQFLAMASAGMALSTGAFSQATVEKGKYKACIIGDSRQGGYGHSLHMAFASRPDVSVLAVADPEEAGCAKHAAECGAARTYADYREMLAKEKPDLVSIAPRWTVNHKAYLLACAEVGAHGIMEKPLCVDLAEADEMIAAVEAKRLKWGIGFNMRATPTMQHLKKALREQGLIGTLLEMRGRGKEDHRAGGEDLLVLGPHVFDLMAWFMDSAPEWCFADITCGGAAAAPAKVGEASEGLGPIVGDTIHALFGFRGGVAGHFESVKNPDTTNCRFGLDLCGSRGMITIRLGATPYIAWLDSPTWTANSLDLQWKTIPGAPPFSIGDPERETYKPIVDDLIQAIEENRDPAVSLKDGRAALEMTQAVFESCVQAGRVPIPLKDRSHPLKRWAAR